MPLAISFQKQRGEYGPIGTNKVRPWIGKTIFVVDAKRFDCCAAGIREQGERNVRRVGKSTQNLHRVVADADHFGASRFEFDQICLQLNQLLTAISSPIGRTVEN